jgi:hypothetical protein
MYDEIKNAALAPTYDMLSMSVYAPQLSNSNDADDGLALNFEGSKRWLTPKTITALANQCLVSTKRRNEWETQIAVALIEIAKKVVEFVNTYPQDDFAKMAQRMLELWSIGLEAFELEAAKKIRDHVALVPASKRPL